MNHMMGSLSLSYLQNLVASPADTTLAIAILLTSLWSFGYIVSSRRDDDKYPPYAPGSMMKHIQMCTSSEYPWWLLDVATQLDNRVFQFSLPSARGRRVISVGEAKTARKILTSPKTTKPKNVYRNIQQVLGAPSVLTCYQDMSIWHSKRKAIVPAFSSNHIKRMNSVAVEKTEEWIKKISMQGETTFDVGQDMLGLVLSALSSTAFEYEMSNEEKNLFISELHLALIEYTLRTPSNPLRNMFGFILSERRRAIAAVKKMRELVLRIMKEYGEKDTTTDGTLIQLVMESDAYPTKEEKVAQLLEFLLAGHDTTGYSIAFILLSLSKHPEEQSKLRDSLRGMASESWGSCDELQYVIKEGMRLHPVASAAGARVLGKDITTNKHDLLPKGSVCFISAISVNRDPAVFHEAESFVPSRWKDPSREMIDALQPFSLGKQSCIGQSLARTMMSAIIARIISEFDLTVEDQGTVDFFLTLKPVGARLRARKV